jgi:anion-transporting  ArsA/GET3 family ATPase
MDAARDLFHDKDRSQFIIVTIPTLMAAAESARLAASLRQEGIPLETLVVNQVGVTCLAVGMCSVLCLMCDKTGSGELLGWLRVVCSL